MSAQVMRIYAVVNSPEHGGHRDGVHHLLVELGIAGRRGDSICRKQVRMVEVDRGVGASTGRVDIQDLY